VASENSQAWRYNVATTTTLQQYLTEIDRDEKKKKLGLKIYRQSTNTQRIIVNNMLMQ
jgi:hypothetical protein